VWLLAVVADPKWKQVNTSGPASIRMFNGLDDGLITAIDARAGALLAERRLSGAVGFVGQTGLIFSQEEDDDGFVMIQILRVHLQRQ
jgi:hypothetical protein